MKVTGAHNQAKYAIDNYPSRKGITTYYLSGNHEGRCYEKTGADMGSLITSGFTYQGRLVAGRKDMVYLGQYSRTLVLPNEVTIQLLHPIGSNPYARSYAQQRRAREMRRDDKPSMQCSGHMHSWCYIIEDYVHMIACFSLDGLSRAGKSALSR